MRFAILFAAILIPLGYALLMRQKEQFAFRRALLPVLGIGAFGFAAQLGLDLKRPGLCQPWVEYGPGTLTSLMAMGFLIGLGLKAAVRSRNA